MSNENPADRRQCQRSASSEAVMLTIDSDQGGTTYRALTVDISPQGARLQTDVYLRSGQHVTLTRENGVAQTLPSQVVWAAATQGNQARQVGVVFLQPIKL
jgi:PilZ domain